MKRLWFGLLLLTGAVASHETSGQESTNRPVRSLPAQLKTTAAHGASETPAAPAPSFQGITRPMVLPLSPTTELTNGILFFARELEETRVVDGAPEAQFVFNFTNVSSTSLALTNVALSCGCTAVKLPPLPWVLQPGEGGQLPVTLEVAGKSGVITKSLQVRTDRGTRTILVKADVEPPADAE